MNTPIQLILLCTAFDQMQRIDTGTYLNVALAVKAHIDTKPHASVLIFDNDTGKQIDFDLRGSDEEIAARLSMSFPEADESQTRTPGRPKIGVVPREVTLLPRHWEWLAEQPGGASVTLRKLVEEARRVDPTDKALLRKLQERAYRVMSAIAGNLPNFEEASRALFANNMPKFRELIADFPADVRDYIIQLSSEGTNSPDKPDGTASERNKRLLANLLQEVWSKGDIERSDAYIAESYTIHHDPGDYWDGQTLKLEEFKARVRQSRASFPDQKFHVQEMVAEGNCVTVTWRWTATHTGDYPGFPATGKPVTTSGITVYYFNTDRRITGHWQVVDRLSIYQQLQHARE